MVDETQLIDEALQVLKEIQTGYRNEDVAGLAARMSQQIRPTMTFDEDIEARQKEIRAHTKGVHRGCSQGRFQTWTRIQNSSF